MAPPREMAALGRLGAWPASAGIPFPLFVASSPPLSPFTAALLPAVAIVVLSLSIPFFFGIAPDPLLSPLAHPRARSRVFSGRPRRTMTRAGLRTHRTLPLFNRSLPLSSPSSGFSSPCRHRHSSSFSPSISLLPLLLRLRSPHLLSPFPSPFPRFFPLSSRCSSLLLRRLPVVMLSLPASSIPPHPSSPPRPAPPFHNGSPFPLLFFLATRWLSLLLRSLSPPLPPSGFRQKRRFCVTVLNC